MDRDNSNIQLEIWAFSVRTFGGVRLESLDESGEKMKITVRVKPNARQDEVTVGADGVFTVKVSVPPLEGRANERLIEVLAAHFKKPKRAVQILTGLRGKLKIVEIM
jgi:uncharacterized protein (TIGR00251 family)